MSYVVCGGASNYENVGCASTSPQQTGSWEMTALTPVECVWRITYFDDAAGQWVWVCTYCGGESYRTEED